MSNWLISHSDFARNSKPSSTNARNNRFFRLYWCKKGMDKAIPKRKFHVPTFIFRGEHVLERVAKKNTKLCSAGLVVFSVSRKSSASCWWSLVFDHLHEKHHQDAARLDAFCVGPKYLIPCRWLNRDPIWSPSWRSNKKNTPERGQTIACYLDICTWTTCTWTTYTNKQKYKDPLINQVKVWHGRSKNGRFWTLRYHPQPAIIMEKFPWWRLGGASCGWTVVADVFFASKISHGTCWTTLEPQMSWRWFGIGRWFSFKNEVILGFFNVYLKEQMSNDKNPWLFRAYLG